MEFPTGNVWSAWISAIWSENIYEIKVKYSPYNYNYGLGNAAIPQGYATNYNYGYMPYGY